MAIGALHEIGPLLGPGQYSCWIRNDNILCYTIIINTICGSYVDFTGRQSFNQLSETYRLILELVSNILSLYDWWRQNLQRLETNVRTKKSSLPVNFTDYLVSRFLGFADVLTHAHCT